jgi:hypothetical protein
MAAGQDRRQRQFDHIGLADNAPGNLLLDEFQRLAGLLDLLNWVVFNFWHGVGYPLGLSIFNPLHTIAM